MLRKACNMIHAIFKQLLSIMLLCCLAPSFASNNGVVKKDFSYWVARADAAHAKKNLSKALIALLRAEKCASFFERFSIIKRQVLMRHSAEKDSTFELEIIQETAKHLFEDIPVLLVQLIALICLFLLGYSFFDRNVLSKKMRILLIFILGMCLLRVTHDHSLRAVILPTKVSVHSGPAENFPVLFSLEGSCVIEVLASAKHFVKIKAGKKIGWCASQAIEQI